jgi:F-type H+/Na+-transporting ATPase subunit alpha
VKRIPATCSISTRLLERACKVSDAVRRGSLTALPIIETQAGDVSAYIPTNVISITDGQIYLETDLFYSGVRPAINVGLSVSRVGGAAQTKAMKQVAGTLRLTSPSTGKWPHSPSSVPTWTRRPRCSSPAVSALVEILKQPQYRPIPFEKQVLLIYAANNGFVDDYPVSALRRYETELYTFLDGRKESLLATLRDKKAIDDDIKSKITAALEEFKKEFTA